MIRNDWIQLSRPLQARILLRGGGSGWDSIFSRIIYCDCLAAAKMQLRMFPSERMFPVRQDRCIQMDSFHGFGFQRGMRRRDKRGLELIDEEIYLIFGEEI